MPRAERAVSESGLYHVIAKGDGGKILFAGDDDRREFLKILKRACSEEGVSVIAWCLMDNHVHLVLQDEQRGLSRAMHRIMTTYARHFNRQAGRIGHVFQERFKSKPIESERYLLEAVRYVHNNPAKAGISRAENYPWSSYRQYVGDSEARSEEPADVAQTELVLELLGGREGFAEFCRAAPNLAYAPPSGKRIPDREMLEVARDALGGADPRDAAAMTPAGRDDVIALLRSRGLSIRQIMRLTGLGRRVISAADMHQKQCV